MAFTCCFFNNELSVGILFPCWWSEFLPFLKRCFVYLVVSMLLTIYSLIFCFAIRFRVSRWTCWIVLLMCIRLISIWFTLPDFCLVVSFLPLCVDSFSFGTNYTFVWLLGQVLPPQLFVLFFILIYISMLKKNKIDLKKLNNNIKLNIWLFKIFSNMK
jgi:hypothetical protein